MTEWLPDIFAINYVISPDGQGSKNEIATICASVTQTEYFLGTDQQSDSILEMFDTSNGDIINVMASAKDKYDNFMTVASSGCEYIKVDMFVAIGD